MKKSQLQIQLYLHLFLFGFIMTSSFSQEIQIGFEKLTRKDGLYDRYIDFIKMDSRGCVWFSSLNGVFKYDGLEMINYTIRSSEYKDDEGLLNNDVQSNFFEASNGDVLFTPKNGINRYFRKSNSFQAIHLTDPSGVKIENGYCLFHLEKDSILWLKANAYIYRYNINSGQQDTICRTKGYRFTVDTRFDGSVKTIYACPWIMGSGVEVIEVEGFHKIRDTLFLADDISPKFRKPLHISKAIVEKDTLVWLFSNQGLIAFNPQNPEDHLLYTLPQGNDAHIKDGAKVADKLFVTSKNRGLWLFDLKQRIFIKNYVEDGSVPLAENDLREIYVDNQDQIWLSYQNTLEVNHSWLYRNKFDNPFDTLDEKLPIVNSIIEDDQKQIWVATKQKGVCVFDYKGALKKRFPYSPNLQPIRQLSLSKNNELWGVSNHAVYQFAQGVWKEQISRSNVMLFALIHTLNENKILSSNLGLTYMLKTSEGYSEDSVKSGFQVPYYLDSKDRNVAYLSNKGSELVVFRKFNSNLLPDTVLDIEADVYNIFEEASKETLLLATSKGIRKLNLRTLQLSELPNFSTHPLLKNTAVYFITKDDHGNYWATNNSGILSVRAGKNTILQYRMEDGYSSQNFSLNANIKAKDGKIWLGTNEGLVVFHPDSIRPYPYGSNIQIKSIQINGLPYLTDTVYSELKSLKLKHNQNYLEFELVAVNHYLAAYNTIRYKLEGYEEEFRNAVNGEIIQFIKVPPGDYNLKIRGFNANGIAGPDFDMKINITPPYWKTLWFMILSSLVAGGILYVINRIIITTRLLKQQKAFEIQQVLEEQRRQFAADMHDDLGSGLTSIQLQVKQIRGSKISEKNLNRIAARANELIRNMREMMWAMEGSSDNLPELIAYLRSYVVKYLEEQNIDCIANTPEDISYRSVNGQIRRNVFLCVKESVHNIVKHADATEVLFEVFINDRLTIVISDNGRGFDPASNDIKGFGLVNMEKRMQKINGIMDLKSTVGRKSGTQIAFDVPLNDGR